MSREQRDLRQQYSLKLSGLPFKTQAINIMEYVVNEGGKTCFVPHNNVGEIQRIFHSSSQEISNTLSIINKELMMPIQLKTEYYSGIIKVSNVI